MEKRLRRSSCEREDRPGRREGRGRGPFGVSRDGAGGDLLGREGFLPGISPRGERARLLGLVRLSDEPEGDPLADRGRTIAGSDEIGRGRCLDPSLIPERQLDRHRAGGRGRLDGDPGAEASRDRPAPISPARRKLDLLGWHPRHGVPADESVITSPASPFADLLGLPDPAGLERLGRGMFVALGVVGPDDRRIVGEDLQLGPPGYERQRRHREPADLGPWAFE